MYIVYKAYSPSNKIYIGITKNSLESRKKSHEYKALSGSNLPFHNSIKKYESDIVWEVIHNNLTKSEAIYFEKQYIALFKDLNISYNVCDGGEGTNGYVFTLEDSKKISKGMAKVNLKNSSKTKLRKSLSKGGKLFKVINANGSTIGTWINMRQCARDLDIPKSHILRCLNGKRKSAYGFTFKYSEAL